MQFYAVVGSNQLEKAMSFYEQLFASIGWKKLFDNPNGGCFFGSIADGWFGVVTPFNGEPASAGNGSMVGFAMNSQSEVDAFYAKAISLGAKDEGAPGDRGGGSYFAYFRDLDGNKLCAWTFSPT
jgi:predicted enzyme related to lactoylglutathione lyase